MNIQKLIEVLSSLPEHQKERLVLIEMKDGKRLPLVTIKMNEPGPAVLSNEKVV